MRERLHSVAAMQAVAQPNPSIPNFNMPNFYTPNVNLNLNLNTNIKNINDLLTSENFKKFEELGKNKNPDLRYISVYSNSITKMLQGLNEALKKSVITVDQADMLSLSYQFIDMYMGWAVDNYNNQQRSANMFEWMMEGILFNLMIVNPYKKGDFSDIMHKQLVLTCYKDLSEAEAKGNLKNSFGMFNSQKTTTNAVRCITMSYSNTQNLPKSNLAP